MCVNRTVVYSTVKYSAAMNELSTMGRLNRTGYKERKGERAHARMMMRMRMEMEMNEDGNNAR